MSVILEAKHISKNFGLTQALKDVSVTIDEGEVIGLIGENGSGKSTLSSIISGVYPQSEGELTLDGKPYKPADTHGCTESWNQYDCPGNGNTSGELSSR